MSQTVSKKARLKASGMLNPHPERVQADGFTPDTFFDPQDLMQVKYEMLRSIKINGLNKSEAAAEFGLSRPTLYQAKAAFEHEGLAGLLPRQRGPKAPHKLDAMVMAFIEQHVGGTGPIQAPRLAALIEVEFGLQVHPRSIERALRRKKKRPTD